MPYPTIADPVAGTVITAAWEIANPLAAVRWLRQLMGNADPPAGSLALISSSPTAGGWAKVPADALAAGAVVSHLTYTPVNQAGDTMTGDLAAPGFSAGAHGVLVTGGGGVNVVGGGPIQGGSTAVGGDLLAIGLQVGPHGILSAAPINVVGVTSHSNVAVDSGGSVLVTGGGGVNVAGGGYSGGDRTIGSISLLGLLVGTNGFSCQGPIYVGNPTPSVVIDAARNVTAASYNGGSTATGDASVRGLNVGDHGIAVLGPVASTAPAGSPFTAVSAGVCTGVNADMTDGFHASATAGPSRIPVADAAGKLDAWISPSALAGVPSNLIAAVAVAGQIPTGWTRYNTLDGLVPVGAGSSFGVTFAENTSYGSAWSHGHSSGGSHNHGSGGLFASGTSDNNNGTNSGQLNNATPGFVASPGPHTHSISNVPVGGNTANGGVGTSSDQWLVPMRALVYVIKT